ncbi:cytokinin riboside 5'-monophosphate phosphoribohydrolase [Aliidongia dinghuensis]|uniref:Cytokinin riboside 5'-monophosphate phosphoribohydrolase n=1 Tax=Aliidongia dinghuensis TaxID=1867774 RepID=A0A8J2YYQ1_9PROT|nr:TIGR00730 family Rossman fold protein [Aliidongia dinghuensis]GGF37075.1 cytokinin riboside 5'-monophosphate phosphoribohydrolase [Aliidongia dinghuensis]
MASIKSVCVYCGSSNRVDARFLDAAAELGRLIGRAGIELIYGGGRVGLMGRVADGVLAEGGRVVGIIPRHLHEREVAHQTVSELVLVDTMHERKQLMAERADGFVVLPGGYGTLDEMFEIITWRQLGLHDKPLVLADVHGYWAPLVDLLDRIIETGFAQPDCRNLYQTVTRIEDILPALYAVSPPRQPVESKWM